jgi:ABC-2 type transport system ATP-binding protein
MPIIEATELTRVFTTRRQKVEAVRGVDISVEAGEIVGFLGPNGAGKTTTLRMLTTLLKPTSGQAIVAGADLRRDPLGVRRRIGYVPQAIGATAGGSDPNCTVAEELRIQGQVYRIPAAQAARRISLLTERLELAGLQDRLCKTLSGGQRRRLDIALGLVHAPGLIFLDEPTTGLDPQSRSNLWSHIRALRAEMGTTIFLTTHYLEEADALCDRVLIIDHGKIIAAGAPDELKHRVSGDIATLSVEGSPLAARDLLAGHPAVREVTVEGPSVRLSVEQGEQALPGLLRILDDAGLRLASIQLARPTLDDVFLTMTGRSLRDDSRPAPARDPEAEAGLSPAAR